MKYGIRTKIKADVGMESLVGIGKSEFPKSFGNYFSFWTTREDAFSGMDIRCVNMWSENLKEARKRFFPDGLVEGVIFTQEADGRTKSWFVVDDPRLPSKDWLHNKFCWTGGSVPSDNEIIREMYSIHGDPTNELEQFTDPETYHARKGGEYRKNANGSATIIYKVKAEPRKLMDNWCIEIAQDVEAVHHPDLEEELTKILAMEVAEEKGFFYAPYIPESLDNILTNPDTPEDDF